VRFNASFKCGEEGEFLTVSGRLFQVSKVCAEGTLTKIWCLTMVFEGGAG